MTEPKCIILQPEYVEHCQCDGTKCSAKCCQNWRIDIDIDTYKKYQRIKNPNIRKKIISSIEPHPFKSDCMKIKLNSDGACPLICSDNLCYIHRNLGEEWLSLTCQVYPRVVRYVGNFQLRILSMTCPVAAEVALFSEHGMDISNVLPDKENAAWRIALKTKKTHLNTDVKMAANVILGCLSILQNTAYTREQRLVILGLYLDKIDDLKNSIHAAGDIAALTVFYNGDKFQKEIDELFENWSFFSTAHGQLLTGILSVMEGKKEFSHIRPLVKQANTYDESYNKFHNLIENTYGKAIDNYWQQEFLYHGFPFCIEGSFLHNYFAFLIAYKLWEMYIYSFFQAYDCCLTKENFLDLVAKYSRKLDHRKNFVSLMIEHTAPFEAEPIKLMQVLLRLK